MTDIASSLEKISQKISEAAKRSGRNRADITLIAVSKTVTADVAQILANQESRKRGGNSTL